MIGREFYTNEGYLVRIVGYKNNREVLIQFDNGSTCAKELTAIVHGRVKNPYHRSVFGIGFEGVGKYPISVNKTITPPYRAWSGCMKRCYDTNLHSTHPTYIECEVCPEWHNFQNFAKWFEENYYEIEGEEMHLDKDLLVKGNKVYSPETCVFVPKSINMFLNKRQNLRGDLPIGVTYKSGNKNKFVSRCYNPLTGTREYLGVYNTPEEAFYIYKDRKEELAKKLSEHYGNRIPQIIHTALNNYRVSITD